MPTELEKAREWLRGLVMRDDVGEGFRRSLLAATDPMVRQQDEQPLTELVHVPQTEPPTWIGGMPDCPPPWECREKLVPDAYSTSGYRMEMSLVAPQPEADPELVAHYRCFGTTALHDLQADKEASQAETGRHIAAIGKVLHERGEQGYGQAR